MQPRDMAFQKSQQTKKNTKRDDRSLDVWLTHLPTPYFHPNFALDPSDQYQANQDPFTQNKYGSSRLVANTVSMIPYRIDMMRFEPPLPTASISNQPQTQPKRKVTFQATAVPLSLTQPTLPTSSATLAMHKGAESHAQVAFEPDPTYRSSKKVYTNHGATAAELNPQLVEQAIENLKLKRAKNQLRTKEYRRKHIHLPSNSSPTSRLFIDGTQVPSDAVVHKTMDNVEFVYSEIGPRVIYTYSSYERMVLWFDKDSKLLASQYSLVEDSIEVTAPFKTSRSIVIDGVRHELYTKAQLKEKIKHQEVTTTETNANQRCSGHMHKLFSPKTTTPQDVITAPYVTALTLDLGSTDKAEMPLVLEQAVNTVIQPHQFGMNQNNASDSSSTTAVNEGAELGDSDESYMRFLNW